MADLVEGELPGLIGFSREAQNALRDHVPLYLVGATADPNARNQEKDVLPSDINTKEPNEKSWNRVLSFQNDSCTFVSISG